MPEVEHRSVGPFLGEHMILGDFHAVASQLEFFKMLGNVMGIVVFAVAGEAQVGGNDELGALSLARCCDGSTNDF